MKASADNLREGRKIQNSMEALIGVASRAMDETALDDVLKHTDVITQAFYHICDVVQIQEENYVDLGLKYAFEMHRNDALQRQLQMASRKLIFLVNYIYFIWQISIF